MSQKKQMTKINSSRINSEYQTTISSSNFPINQTMLSSNSKEYKNQSNISQLKCTCNHTNAKTYQKQGLKCTCKIYKNNNINNMNSIKTESRKSRFEQITTPINYKRTNNYIGSSGQNSVRSQSFKMNTFSSGRNNERLVCTCKHKRYNNFNTIRTYSEIKRPLYLWRQKTENLQILSAPAPLLTTQFVQNLAIIQNPKPVSKIEKEVVPQIETKKIEEKKEENVEEKKEENIEEIEKEEENEQEINEEENEQEINEEENEQEKMKKKMNKK